MKHKSCMMILAALSVVAVSSGVAMAQGKERGRKSGDPGAECIRETERTYPPRTISRKQRDLHVEACLRGKRG